MRTFNIIRMQYARQLLHGRDILNLSRHTIRIRQVLPESQKFPDTSKMKNILHGFQSR